MEGEFDQILASVGDKGKYQKLLLWFYYFGFCFITPWIILVPIFLTTVPDHWCHVDGKPPNMTLEEWKNWTIPWEEFEGGLRYSKCKQYKLIDQYYSIQAPKLNENRTVIGCQNGWDYDTTWYDETLASRNNWVCDDEHKKADYISVGLGGKITGVIVFNRLSDIFGRKVVSLSLLKFYGIFSLLRLQFNSGWTGFFITYLSTVPFPAVIQIGLVHVIEQIHNSWRTHATGIFFFVWMIGMCCLPLFAWLTRSWQWITVVTSVPFFISLLAWLCVEESPRWLASRGKISEAAVSLRKIAQINGVEPPSDLEKSLTKYVKEKNKDKQESSLDFLKSKKLMKLAIIMTGCWCCNLVVYDSLNYNVVNLGGNQFINFFLLGIVEGPATLIAWVTSQTIGRRLSQIIYFVALSISTAFPIFLASTQGVETVICVLLSKILISGSFYALYLQMVEIYPTSQRTTLMGLSNFVVMLADLSSPYIAFSSSSWSRTPYVILTFLALIGSIMSLFIPETLNQALPQTISDSEKYYGDWQFWKYKGSKPKDWIKLFHLTCFSKNKNGQN